MEIETSQFYNLNNPTSFKGLTAKLTKATYSKKEVVALFKRYERKSNGIVGQLPHEWINLIPFEKRKLVIKNLFQELGEAFSLLRKNNFSERINLLEKRLNKIFKNVGILKRKQSVNLTPIGQGGFGQVYKLKLLNKSYALKVFKVNNDNKSWKYLENGNFYEQALGQYLKKKIPKRNKNVSYMYYGDLKNSLQLSTFEEKSKPFKGTVFDFMKIGLKLSPNEHFTPKNNIANKIIDLGGIHQIFPFYNKQLIYMAKELNKSDDKIYEFMNQTLNTKDKILFNNKIKALSMLFTNNEDQRVVKSFYKQILPKIDNDTFVFILKNINSIPKSQHRTIYKSAIRNKNIFVQQEFAKQVPNLKELGVSSDEILKIIKKLTSRKSGLINEQLSACFDYIPKKEIPFYFNSFFIKSTPKTRENLALNLYRLPEEKQIPYLKKLLAYESPQIVDALFKVNPYTLEYNIISVAMKIMIDNCNSLENIKTVINYINKLPHSERNECFKKLYLLNDKDINKLLIKQLDNLSFKQAKYWENLLNKNL